MRYFFFGVAAYFFFIAYTIAREFTTEHEEVADGFIAIFTFCGLFVVRCFFALTDAEKRN